MKSIVEKFTLICDKCFLFRTMEAKRYNFREPWFTKDLAKSKRNRYVIHSSHSLVSPTFPLKMYVLLHDHSPTGLFRASAAQQDRPNACEGATGSRQTVMNDPGAKQPSQMFFFTCVKTRPQHRELHALLFTNGVWVL